MGCPANKNLKMNNANKNDRASQNGSVTNSIDEFCAQTPEIIQPGTPLQPKDLSDCLTPPGFSRDSCLQPTHTIAIRKTLGQDYFRIHPEDGQEATFSLLLDEASEEFYLVASPVVPLLVEKDEPKFQQALLLPGVTATNQHFLFLCKVSGEQDRWYHGRLEAADRARTEWIRFYYSKRMKKYIMEPASTQTMEPQFLEMDHFEIVCKAFDDRIIRDESHPIIRRLQGKF